MVLNPTICNICGEESVEYVSNEVIYGRKYGSGMCYHCTNCGAYVGTHEPRPKEALGLLANAQMRTMKMECHDIFDSKWKSEPDKKSQSKRRRQLYAQLADELGIPVEECHFGWFDIPMLKKAYAILEKW